MTQSSIQPCWGAMKTIKRRLQELEHYLDDQTWWQRTYWPVYRFFHWFGPRALYMEAKYFIQRGRRGYSDRDLWNANYHIARTVLAFLDSPRMGLQFWDGDFNKPHEWQEEHHSKIETEIRWLLEEFIHDDIEQWEKWGDADHQKRVARANRLFGKYWMSLWDQGDDD